jgi:hypothetical protein
MSHVNVPIRGGESRLRVPSSVLMQELSGESVLLNLDTERYFGLDAVGTRMWTALTQASTLQDAYASLLDTFEVEPDRLARDLETLVDELVRNGLLETSAE